MAYVYILKSLKDGDYYIGSTVDFQRRLRKHQAGEVKSTRCRLPMITALVQKYKTYKEAKRIELRIKKLKRKDYINKMIKDGHIKMVA